MWVSGTCLSRDIPTVHVAHLDSPSTKLVMPLRLKTVVATPQSLKLHIQGFALKVYWFSTNILKLDRIQYLSWTALLGTLLTDNSSNTLLHHHQQQQQLCHQRIAYQVPN